MAETIIEQINSLARDIHKKMAEGIKLKKIVEFDKLYNLIITQSEKYIKYKLKYKLGINHIDSSMCTSEVNNAILAALNAYDGERDFLPFYGEIFKNKIKDELRKINNNISESLDQPINCKDENKEISLMDKIEDKSRIADKIEDRSIIERYYQSFATICIEQKKKYSNRKTYCYLPLFFTDKLVFGVFNIESWFDDTVKNNSNKFDEAAVIEFLNTLVTGKCNSVTDIKKYKCRLLSEFTGKQADAKKLCCEKDPNYHVFNSFLKQQNKDISQSAFSQHKNKVDEHLEPFKKDLSSTGE